MSRLLKITGLLCKRDLQKRQYSAKGTYNSRSQLIVATHTLYWRPVSIEALRLCCDFDADCNALHTATHCSTLQHTAAHCNTLQHTATHCNTLQHTVTHCNTLQHTVTHCNTLQHNATQCNTLQHSATHCNKTQHSATHLCVSRLCNFAATLTQIRDTAHTTHWGL